MYGAEALTLGRNFNSFLGSERFTGKVVALRMDFSQEIISSAAFDNRQSYFGAYKESSKRYDSGQEQTAASMRNDTGHDLDGCVDEK